MASRQRAKRYSPASAPAAAVAGLTDPEQLSRKLQRALRPAVAGWLLRYALNVRCFAVAGAAAPAAAQAAATGRAGAAP